MLARLYPRAVGGGEAVSKLEVLGNRLAGHVGIFRPVPNVLSCWRIAVKKPRPPRTGREPRQRVLAEHDIVGAGALAILEVAVATLDQALKAERILAQEGLMVRRQRGARAHPLINVSRDARNRLLAALRSIGLELS